ncbi:DNA primase [Faecalibacterium sp. An58]|uniref:CHC2 zinc finger domain-containing protein n=1 Tax=Faecalibacterium sp. An58 TaxID=1965648 RepID=UPI000B568F40|nr:CHC2 zinc finger domain-containing protein [Faecalibacterium sp. An58]OUN67579.1 DNA primase [Faecalibacterium sp. An58]
MNLFQTIKAAVTVKQAAALYGLPITTTGMTRCLFHEDHTPSMKLNDACYYCFGCGATGDVIDLTARLFDLSSLQAARKLAQDFGLGPDKPPSGAVALPKPLATLSDAQQEDIAYCLRVLHDYRDLLTQWQTEFAPLSPEEPLNERFVEALHMLATVDDLINCLAFGPASRKAIVARQLLAGQLLPMVESRLDSIERKETA